MTETKTTAPVLPEFFGKPIDTPAGHRWAGDFEALLGRPATGHVCSRACVAATKVECGCSSAPTECEDCARFFAEHPEALELL